jgi:hypothetical protein
MRDWSRMTSFFASLPIAAAVTLSPSVTLGCGYDDDVSVARGLLNWIYPDALYVVGAITAAVADHHLPPPNFDAAKPDLFGSEYRKTVQSLERFGTAISASHEAPPLSFSLVLVEPMLWTRFEVAQHELHTHAHVTGPTLGDLVVVSGEAVIGEIANGGLTIGQAHRLGFIRLYGSQEQKAEFIGAYRLVGNGPAANLGRARVQSTIVIEPQQSRAPEAGGELAGGPGHHGLTQSLLGANQ